MLQGQLISTNTLPFLKRILLHNVSILRIIMRLLSETVLEHFHGVFEVLWNGLGLGVLLLV